MRLRIVVLAAVVAVVLAGCLPLPRQPSMPIAPPPPTREDVKVSLDRFFFAWQLVWSGSEFGMLAIAATASDELATEILAAEYGADPELALAEVQDVEPDGQEVSAIACVRFWRGGQQEGVSMVNKIAEETFEIRLIERASTGLIVTELKKVRDDCD